jgi:TPR repeat protein
MNQIGHMYRFGEGVTKNAHTGIEWYTKAANQGHVEAQFNLAYTYQFEDEVEDLQKAVNWFQKAAENDHRDAKEQVKQLNGNGYFAEEEQKGIYYRDYFYFVITNDKIKHVIME